MRQCSELRLECWVGAITGIEDEPGQKLQLGGCRAEPDPAGCNPVWLGAIKWC